MSDRDRAGEFGPIYLPALRRIRDLWLECEPLTDTVAYDDVIAPTELQIGLTDGLGDADAARLDIQWSERGMYSFHYVDSADVNWRFDRHRVTARKPTASAVGGSAYAPVNPSTELLPF